jgi:hypothetical protein
MKYKYLELFGDERTKQTLRNFDKVYEADFQKLDNQVFKKEQELRKAASEGSSN